MKLTTKGQYAVQAMIEIATHNTRSREPISLREVSTNQDIPLPFLEQIAIKLRKANLIKSTRGSSGGYVLSKDIKKITLADILEVIEGSINVAPNASNKYEVTNRLWEKINQNITTILKSISLEDLYFDSVSYKASKDNDFYVS